MIVVLLFVELIGSYNAHVKREYLRDVDVARAREHAIL